MAEAFSLNNVISSYINTYSDADCNVYVEGDELISFDDNNSNGNGYSASTNFDEFMTFEECIMTDANGNNTSNYEDYDFSTFSDDQGNGYDYETALNNYITSDASGNGFEMEEESTGFDFEW